ncbi:MAG: HEPN domain-containing protein [Nitrospirota bacterium]
MTRDEIIDYWLTSAKKDYKAMGVLFRNGHYIWALFLGHLVIEKTLKAAYVKHISANIPYTHDLVKIAEKAKLELTELQKNLLDEITTFNIKARYPDFKGRFYKKATRKFTERYIVKIKELRKWLIQKIKT